MDRGRRQGIGPGLAAVALGALVAGNGVAQGQGSWIGHGSPASGGVETTAIAPGTASAGVLLRGRLDRSSVRPGSGRSLHLVADLEVTGGAPPDRRPLALGIVLDVSGSMGSERKLEHVVEATRYVVDRLGGKDRVAIVAYDSSPHVVYVPEGTIDAGEARRALGKLRPGSGTNMEIGIRLGLEKLAKIGVEGAAKRLLVLSDGRANEGIHSVEGLAALAAGARESGATVSTFGVGADYNEDLMAKVAEAAGGNYHVIDRGAELAAVFQKEFQELGSATGRSVRMAVEAGAGLELEEAYGYPISRDGAMPTVTLRDFFHGMRTKVVLRFKAEGPCRGASSSIRLALEWEDVTTGKPQSLIAVVPVTWVEDEAKEAASADPEIVALVQELEGARVYDQASREFEKGNADEARKLLETQMRRNAAAIEDSSADPARLQAQQKQFEDALRFYNGPASAHSREGKAAVKRMKQEARMSNY